MFSPQRHKGKKTGRSIQTQQNRLNEAATLMFFSCVAGIKDRTSIRSCSTAFEQAYDEQFTTVIMKEQSPESLSLIRVYEMLQESEG